ncbi:MAG: POTRA domain-containing protein [Cyanobacteria bacterium J06633_8]
MKKVSAFSIGITTASILGFVNLTIVQAQTLDTKNTLQQQSRTEVLVAEVSIDGVEGKLEEIVANTIKTQTGKTITRAQLQQDINAIFATGYFANVRAVPEETSGGVKMKFIVQPNRILLGVNIEGNQVLPQEVVNQSFKEQYGKILNLKKFQAGIKKINQWYKDNGYVLAQVIDTPKVNPDGTVSL